jgi:hypothetical protein
VNFDLHGAAQLLRIDVRLRDEACRLLFGDPQGVLELRSEAAVGGSSGLVELGLKVLHDGGEPLDLLRGLRLVRVGLDDLTAKILDRAVDFFLLVSAHLRAEV